MNETTEIIGICLKKSYKSEKNNWGVVILKLDDGTIMTVNGQVGNVEKGQKIAAKGLIVVHEKYGEQFKAESYRLLNPVDVIDNSDYSPDDLSPIANVPSSDSMIPNAPFSDAPLPDMPPDFLSDNIDNFPPVGGNTPSSSYTQSDKDSVEISGKCVEITYKKEDKSWGVIIIETDDDELTVTGPVGDVEEEEDLTLIGKYAIHPKYGRQFKADHCRRTLPSTTSGIFKYLQAGAIKGITPKLAELLIQKFGADTLNVLENEPEKIKAIAGIGGKRYEQIIESVKVTFGFRLVMEFLSEFGINAKYTAKAVQIYGGDCLEKIKENPYILCCDEIDLSFAKADNIATSLELPFNSEMRIAAAIKDVLKFAANEGYTYLPVSELLNETTYKLKINFEDFQKGLAYDKKETVEFELGVKCVALKKYFLCEKYIAKHFLKINGKVNPINQDMLATMIEDEEKFQKIEFSEKQKKAIEIALTSKAMILTGGPGTGKTTTLRGVIDIFIKLKKRVFVTAPTGRAAQRAMEVTGYPAKTIHRLIEVIVTDDNEIHAQRNEMNPLDCDVVIVDEMSMVDVQLMKSLIEAIPDKCCLIMVGDPEQLPSVGAGNVLHDLINSEKIQCVQLKEIFRQGQLSAIVTNAHKIINGEMPDLTIKDNDFFFFYRNTPDSSKVAVSELIKRVADTYQLNPRDDIQIITPARQGPLGCIELNRFLQAQFNPKAASSNEVRSPLYILRVGDKIMQIHNNYEIKWRKDSEQGNGVFNGDIGIIEQINLQTKQVTTNFDGRIAVYSYEMLFQLELAYATTVHKSQGSEYNTVIIPLFDGFNKLCYRNLLYTAVTRAKKRLILVGTQYQVKKMVDNDKKVFRYTVLKQLLNGELNGE